VREREAAVVNKKKSLKRKRKADEQAFQNADAERKKSVESLPPALFKERWEGILL